MADAVTVQPPLSVVLDYLTQDAGFIGDLRRIQSLNDDQFASLVSALAGYNSFLDADATAEVVSKAIGDHPDKSRIAGIAFSINGLVRGHAEDLDEAVEMLASAIKENSKDLGDDAQRAAVADRLRQLIGLVPGFRLYWKARQLASATGRELKTVRVICDIRPVFDEPREQIVGALPIATLSLSFAQSPHVDLILSEKELRELAEEVQAALGKLDVIRGFMGKHNVLVPDTL